ncbi:hypothetical protein DFH08DRAFT_826074 [Mycena albidolilacea]|uniref:Uncharacterized protein n=1 Tax=Mycena albidolilacea TaxID=1033008 RepID=A0AAD6Z154_9AGAR|nr:hypothetical protein DFH08DRAFT_826074 [Mycena albidolilacea]
MIYELANELKCATSASPSLIFVELSRAFTLSLPDKLNSGTRVTVQWSRNNADPTSFGLMQRSLQGNQPILSVTPVDNTGGAVSGTVSVLFNTPGQVLLSTIAQLSLSSGEKPNQLSAGKQLTVVPVLNAVNVPGTTTFRTTSTSTRGTTSPPKVPSNTLSATGTPIPIQPTSSLFTPKSSVGVSSALVAPSSTETAGSSPQSTPSRGEKPGPHRSTVIALAVILPLLIFLLVLFCIILRQRTSTRHRIDAFTAVWTRRPAARGTISSFGDVEAGWMAADRPLSQAVSESDADDQGAARSLPSPIARRQQKLQLMVERLSERNAALEREVDSLASASVLMHQPHFPGGLGLGPPPVYMESPESIKDEISTVNVPPLSGDPPNIQNEGAEAPSRPHGSEGQCRGIEAISLNLGLEDGYNGGLGLRKVNRSDLSVKCKICETSQDVSAVGVASNNSLMPYFKPYFRTTGNEVKVFAKMQYSCSNSSCERFAGAL